MATTTDKPKKPRGRRNTAPRSQNLGNRDDKRRGTKSSIAEFNANGVGGTPAVMNSKPGGKLTEQQVRFIKAFVHDGLPQMAAAREAKYSAPATAAWTLLKSPKIQHAIALEREKYEAAAEMTRKKVMDGFQEAIDMARTKADPVAMISGWREVAKMCGYYEPTRHQLEVSVNGQVLMQKLQTMSDEELLRYAEENGDSIIDGEFEELKDPSMALVAEESE